MRVIYDVRSLMRRHALRSIPAVVALVLAASTSAAHAVALPASSRMVAHVDIPRVPGTPTSVTISRIGGLNAGASARKVTTSVTVSSSHMTQSLAAEINALPHMTGMFACPRDDASALRLVFHSADATNRRVRVGLQGCQTVTAKGASAGRLFDDPRLLPKLLALLNVPDSHTTHPHG
jgi:hypothetical protein